MGYVDDTQLPVTRIIADLLPATLDIAGYAFAVTLVVSVPLGVLMAALTRGGGARGPNWRSPPPA